MGTSIIPIGIFLLVTGSLLLFLKKKRQFDRTNPMGVEEFTSYSRKLLSLAFDGLLAGVSFLLLAVGTIVLAFHYQDSWGWIVLLPVLAFVLLGML